MQIYREYRLKISIQRKTLYTINYSTEMKNPQEFFDWLVNRLRLRVRFKAVYPIGWFDPPALCVSYALRRGIGFSANVQRYLYIAIYFPCASISSSQSARMSSMLSSAEVCGSSIAAW